MKRLLLAPLLLGLIPSANAFPFDDIVVKTDLGEKYIVKKSALTIKNIFKKSDYISLVTEKIISENKYF